MTLPTPLHPGEIVKDALIDSTGFSVTEAAIKHGISRTAFIPNSFWSNGLNNVCFADQI